ncbi:MAG TPA: DUF5686 family protein [Bacteroidia bacterium]|nr:DUF5686 family protein [Bacteroidia bacterium]
MFRSLYALAFFCLISFIGLAQTTRITGKVYNAESSEPMPFVNVLAVGTTKGTVTDMDGNFTLVLTIKADSLRIFFIGFEPQTIAISQGVAQTLTIGLVPKPVDLSVVEIRPGENPAVTILKQVWKNKALNDKENLNAYQYESYNKLEFDLTNISPNLQKKKMLKPVDFIFDRIDSTNPYEKPHLPLFFSESVAEYYYRNDPKSQKEIIKASKVSGVEDASIAQFTGDMYQNVNIYDNNIIVFGKTFVSPISTNALLYYKYYLVDSMVIDGHWCHQIQFKPKRKQELLFVGNIWIADTSFAVKRLEMNIVDDANINYINAFYVIQEYDNTSGAWMMTRERVIAEFVLAEKKTGFYGRKTVSYRGITVNQPKSDEFYTRLENLMVQAGAEKRDESYWNNVRHDSLSATEQGIYDMVDSVQNLPIYKTWEDIVITAYTGYKVMGPVEYGPWYKTLSLNQIEGARLRVGGRTSNSFSRWVEFSGYTAYGFKDEEFKYAFAFKSYITKKPRQLTGINYKNDLEILGLSNNQFTSDNIMATLFRRNPFSNFTRVEEYQWWYEREWYPGLNSKFYFVNRHMFPIGEQRYVHREPDGSFESVPRITTSEMRLNVRFAYDEKYVESVFSRVSMGTRYPVVQMIVTAGFKGVFGSGYEYQRVSINVDDRLRFGPFGYLNYILEAGKTFGVVPWPLMVLHPGNETYVYDWSAFNMMNYYEFASDQYAQATLIHHFDGFFLNHIPLMRKLKWREIASFKWLTGTVSNRSRQEILFPPTLYSLSRGPYMEAGVGLENVFKFFRIDCFWRLAYLDNPRVQPVGLRVSLQVMF